MKKFTFETYTIEIFNDNDYTSGSADNVNQYAKEYHSDIGYYRPSSQHGIRIYNDETETNSCILLGYGGGTAIHENSALLDGDRLLVCCGDAVFCLGVPELNLLWTTRADEVTAFQVFKPAVDYIVHGELAISGLNRDGKINWEFSGRDIFVTLEDPDSFKLERDHIVLTDFEYNVYKIDFNGRSLLS